MRAVVAFALGFVALSAGCGRSDKSESAARHFETRGIVRGFAPDRSTIDIEHEAIPGFMSSMTMPFTPLDRKEIASLTLRDAIAFRLNVTARDSWIDQIKKIDPAQVQLPPRKTETAATIQPTDRLRAGDSMPPFELTNQDGETITLETMRGRPFLLTFIFTRCPIPNFCPLMTRHFAELQEAIRSGTGALAKTRLLSISFDPENDTPAVLREQAQHENADPLIWIFATGAPAQIKAVTERFSVLVQPEAGTISHSLATALVDADGRIVEIWRGNGWKPEEVLSRVAKLEASPTPQATQK